MSSSRQMMLDWVVEALEGLGRSATIREICKYVWEKDEYRDEILANEKLTYTWQYDIRWTGDILRREGKLLPTDSKHPGIWTLAPEEGECNE